jgi:hypothetical protein
LKLSDDEIEEAFTDPRQLSNHFTRSAVSWKFCLMRSQIRVPKKRLIIDPAKLSTFRSGERQRVKQEPPHGEV